MPSVIVFIFGLCVGSFINVLVFRLGKKGGIVSGRSECRNCSKALRWYDLFPVVSFIFLKGKCRHCRNKISAIYPTVELVTAFSFLFFYLSQGQAAGFLLLYQFTVLGALVSLVFFDYLYMILPDKIIFPMIFLVLLFDILFKKPDLTNLLLSALAFGGFFGIINLVSRGRWVGLGDAKLAFLMGLILGYPLGFLSIVLSVWLAALFGMGLVVFGRAGLKTALPFGSFLAAVLIFFIIFQNELQKIIYKFL